MNVTDRQTDRRIDGHDLYVGHFFFVNEKHQNIFTTPVHPNNTEGFTNFRQGTKCDVMKALAYTGVLISP
jgi:hypothetical protein